MTAINSIEERRLTLTQAAAALQISERTLNHWVKAGKLRRVKVSPRKAYVLQSEVDRVLAGMPAA